MYLLLNLHTFLIFAIIIYISILLLVFEYQKLKIQERNKLNSVFLELKKEKLIKNKAYKYYYRNKWDRSKNAKKLNHIKLESIHIQFSLF